VLSRLEAWSAARRDEDEPKAELRRPSHAKKMVGRRRSSRPGIGAGEAARGGGEAAARSLGEEHDWLGL
jgi:hypothetical protein